MVDLRENIYYLPSQENIGCCTASATLLAAEMLCNVKQKREVFSRLFLYYFTRKDQDRIGKRGAELSATLNAFELHGVCRDHAWPLLSSRENTEPNHIAIDEAKNFKLEEFCSVSTSDIRYQLDNKMPVVVGMMTGRKFWKLSGRLDTHDYEPVNEVSNRASLGHAVTIVGYNDSLNGGSLIIANSLGARWGDKGYGAIPYSCIDDIGEAYSIIKFAGMSW